MNAVGDHYRAGNLDAAVDAAIQTVREKPTDRSARFSLVEMLCIAGDFERADKHLDAMLTQSDTPLVTMSLYRQLLRAEVHRHETFLQGRPPELVDDPGAAIKWSLQALLDARDGDVAVSEPPGHGVTFEVNGQPAEQLRDLDDVLAAVLELHTPTGKYFWVPWSAIESITISPAKRPIDLLWRHAKVAIDNGPDGDVYLPAIYVAPAKSETATTDDGPWEGETDDHRLGRRTDWVSCKNGWYRGVGQKIFAAGETDWGLHDIQQINIAGESVQS
ncbi:MAG: type VI secretion system accessory protein TagJ [Planctomycetota bacterium]